MFGRFHLMKFFLSPFLLERSEPFRLSPDSPATSEYSRGYFIRPDNIRWQWYWAKCRPCGYSCVRHHVDVTGIRGNYNFEITPMRIRSEERRGGHECVSTCRYRCLPHNTKKHI